MGRRDGVSHLSMQARAHCAVDKRWRFQTNRGWAAKIIIIYIYIKNIKKRLKVQHSILVSKNVPMAKQELGVYLCLAGCNNPSFLTRKIPLGLPSLDGKEITRIKSPI